MNPEPGDTPITPAPSAAPPPWLTQPAPRASAGPQPRWIALAAFAATTGTLAGVLLGQWSWDQLHRPQPVAPQNAHAIGVEAHTGPNLSSGSGCTIGTLQRQLDMMSARQATNGQTIIATGLRTHTPHPGIVAALAVSMRQAHLLNVANPNVPASVAMPHDVVGQKPHVMGILAQPPTEGTVKARMIPERAARIFFMDLHSLGDDWQSWAPELIASRMSAPIPEPPARPGRPCNFERYSDYAALATEFYDRFVDKVANDMAIAHGRDGDVDGDEVEYGGAAESLPSKTSGARP